MPLICKPTAYCVEKNTSRFYLHWDFYLSYIQWYYHYFHSYFLHTAARVILIVRSFTFSKRYLRLLITVSQLIGQIDVGLFLIGYSKKQEARWCLHEHIKKFHAFNMRGYWKNVENSSFDNSNGRQVLLPNILVDILLQLFISWLLSYTVVIKKEPVSFTG